MVVLTWYYDSVLQNVCCHTHAFMHLDTSKLLKITYTMHTIVWTNFNFRYICTLSIILVQIIQNWYIYKWASSFIFCHNIFWIYYMILLWSKCLFCINCIVLVKVMSQLKYCSIETWQLIESKLSESIF